MPLCAGAASPGPLPRGPCASSHGARRCPHVPMGRGRHPRCAMRCAMESARSCARGSAMQSAMSTAEFPFLPLPPPCPGTRAGSGARRERKMRERKMLGQLLTPALSSCAAPLPERLPCFPRSHKLLAGPWAGSPRRCLRDELRGASSAAGAPLQRPSEAAPLPPPAAPFSPLCHPALQGFTPWHPLRCPVCRAELAGAAVYPGRAGRWLADSFRNTL